MQPVWNLKKGDVVQLGQNCKNPMFSFCMMTVTDPKTFGAQGYVQALGENGEPGGLAYYRAEWSEFEYVGSAVWMEE